MADQYWRFDDISAEWHSSILLSQTYILGFV